MTDKKTFFLLASLIIVLLGFAVYCNSLRGAFIWDDGALITDNRYIKDWSHLPDLLTKDIGSGASSRFNFWRPMQMISYTLDYSLWGFKPFGYHLSNILLHMLVALAILWLAYLLFQDRLIALFTSLIFVVLPVHTEAVAYISGRAELLAALFILLTLILYIKQISLQKPVYFILLLLSYVLALFSKEYSLITPALLILYSYVFKRRLLRKEFFSILALSIVYIVVHMTFLKILPASAITTTMLQRIPGFFVAITEYVRLLMFPFNLHMEYGDPIFSFYNAKAILGAVMLISLSVIAFRKRESNQLVSFAILWFFVTLLPVSNLYPINAYMAEHWLYLSSIGFCLCVAAGLVWMYRGGGLKSAAIISMAGILSYYSILTIGQNRYWNNSILFYTRTLQYAPASAKMYNNLCKEYVDVGKSLEAINSCQKAIEFETDFSTAYQNLGMAFKQAGQYAESLQAYEKAIALDSRNERAYNSLGVLYSAMGRTEEAITQFNRAIAINPNFSEAYANLGNAYSRLNKIDEAIGCYKKALEVDPKSPHAAAYNANLATLFAVRGNKTEVQPSIRNP